MIMYEYHGKHGIIRFIRNKSVQSVGKYNQGKSVQSVGNKFQINIKIAFMLEKYSFYLHISL